MKAVIMAAGIGSRLTRKVKHLPKCLLVFGGETILGRNVRLLKKNGIKEVIVVAGYRANLVREEIGELATVVVNPFFRVTNSIASFWFAHRQVDLYDDLIVFNGDVVYEEEVLRRILRVEKSPTMLIDTSVIENADYRLKTEQDCIVDQGKDLGNGETSGEYVGFVKLGKDFTPLYLSRVTNMVQQLEQYNMWWEESLFAIRDEFKMKIYALDIKGLFWAEADYLEDIERIEEWFKNGHESSEDRLHINECDRGRRKTRVVQKNVI